MNDRDRHLMSLSDSELVLWWQAFGTYPTPDRLQRARLDVAVRAVAAEKRIRRGPPGEKRRKEKAA